MVSKLVISIFAIVLVGLVIAQDYEGGYEGDSGDSGDGGGDGGSYPGEGYHGGDYDSEGGGETEGDGGEGEQSEEESAASHPRVIKLIPLQRQRRSLNSEDSKRVLSRVRRGGYGRVGPVYTYQKTDYNGNFKWGVRHNVGRQYGHGK